MPKTHIVHLYFNKPGLTGIEYGKYSWFYQVEPTLKYNNFQKGDIVRLIWDPEVVLVTSSFFVGFFKKIANEIGYDGVIKDITIESPQKIVYNNSNVLTLQDIT